jgi:hypothetical protein
VRTVRSFTAERRACGSRRTASAQSDGAPAAGQRAKPPHAALERREGASCTGPDRTGSRTPACPPGPPAVTASALSAHGDPGETTGSRQWITSSESGGTAGANATGPAGPVVRAVGAPPGPRTIPAVPGRVPARGRRFRSPVA